jgi:hypothetical protein
VDISIRRNIRGIDIVINLVTTFAAVMSVSRSDYPCNYRNNCLVSFLLVCTSDGRDDRFGTSVIPIALLFLRATAVIVPRLFTDWA